MWLLSHAPNHSISELLVLRVTSQPATRFRCPDGSPAHPGPRPKSPPSVNLCILVSSRKAPELRSPYMVPVRRRRTLRRDQRKCRNEGCISLLDRVRDLVGENFSKAAEALDDTLLLTSVPVRRPIAHEIFLISYNRDRPTTSVSPSQRPARFPPKLTSVSPGATPR